MITVPEIKRGLDLESHKRMVFLMNKREIQSCVESELRIIRLEALNSIRRREIWKKQYLIFSFLKRFKAQFS